MGVCNRSCSRLLGALGILALAVSAAVAQNAQDTKTPPAGASTGGTAPAGSNESPPKPAKKAPSAQPAKVSTAEKKPKRGQYATEEEARSHCHGTIVWVDQNNFNHYRGSREWAKKPGAFACEGGSSD
jgi:hypothetical protein